MMQEPRERSTATHYYWLDLCRFLAAFLVLLAHARGGAFVEFGKLPDEQRNFLVAAFFSATRLAEEAVIIFFVLSGFLVGGATIARTADGTFRPMDYAIDRVTRIFVPFVPALIFTALVSLIRGSEFSVLQFIGNLLCLQNIFTPPFGGNAPLWSLSFEVWFYVLGWAAAVFIVRREHRTAAAFVLLLSCVVFTVMGTTYLFCWLFGAVLFVHRPDKNSFGGLLAGLTILSYGIFANQVWFNPESPLFANFSHFVPPRDTSRLLIATGIGLLLCQAILLVPRTRGAARVNSAGAALAAFSYTLYLMHYPMLQLIQHFAAQRAPEINATSFATFAFDVIFCLAGSWGFYWLFERRTGDVRKWIRRRVGTKAPGNLEIARTTAANDKQSG